MGYTCLMINTDENLTSSGREIITIKKKRSGTFVINHKAKRRCF